MIFPVFGKISDCFFPIKIRIKKVLRNLMYFPAFGKILVLAAAFSYQNFNQKVLRNWFFELLAGETEKFRHSIFQSLGFCQDLWNFSGQPASQNGSHLGRNHQPCSLQPCKFCSFWQDLGFCGSFFPIKISIKKVLRNRFFQLLARFWFWRQFFLSQFLFKKWRNWFVQLLARSWFWRGFFPIKISIQKVLRNWFF